MITAQNSDEITCIFGFILCSDALNLITLSRTLKFESVLVRGDPVFRRWGYKS